MQLSCIVGNPGHFIQKQYLQLFIFEINASTIMGDDSVTFPLGSWINVLFVKLNKIIIGSARVEINLLFYIVQKRSCLQIEQQLKFEIVHGSEAPWKL